MIIRCLVVLAVLCHVAAGISYYLDGNTGAVVWVLIATTYGVQVWRGSL